MEQQLKVVFCTNSGKEETKVFTEQPFGMLFPDRMPIIIKRIRPGSPAEQLGVELGWTIQSIGCTHLAGKTIKEACDALREATRALHCCMLVRKPPLDAQSVTRLSAKFKSVGEADAVPILKRYGYVALTAKSWEMSVEQPELHLGMVDGYRVISTPEHHTWYAISGTVTAGKSSATRQWLVERRLAHIRTLLHDPVKQGLGKAYSQHFAKARFAHHGALPGTAMRLASWLAALSKAINSKALPPALVASILVFLEAPLLDENAGQVALTDESLRALASNEEAQREGESCEQDSVGNNSPRGTDDETSDHTTATTTTATTATPTTTLQRCHQRQ